MAKRRSMKRRMTKRRMSKTRKGIKKMIRKSRKIRGGGFFDLFTGKKTQQQNYDIRNESNSGFGNQPRIGAQPIKQYTEEEYTEYRNNPNKYASDKPIDEITMKEKSSWW